MDSPLFSGSQQTFQTIQGLQLNTSKVTKVGHMLFNASYISDERLKTNCARNPQSRMIYLIAGRVHLVCKKKHSGELLKLYSSSCISSISNREGLFNATVFSIELRSLHTIN